MAIAERFLSVPVVMEFDVATGGYKLVVSTGASASSPLYVADKLLTYLGGQMLTGTAASIATSPTAGTEAVKIMANGGAVYYAINDASAGLTSEGYISDGNLDILPLMSNLTSLHVYMAVGVNAHLQYFKQS